MLVINYQQKTQRTSVLNLGHANYFSLMHVKTCNLIQILLFLENTEEEFLVFPLAASTKCFSTYRDCSPLDPKESKISLMFVRCKLQSNAMESYKCLSITAIQSQNVGVKIKFPFS